MSKYKQILDSLQDVVFEMDLHANITFANHTALSFFGISQEELAEGINAIDYILPEDRPRAVTDITNAIMGEGAANSEYTLIKKDGTRFPVVIRSNPIIKNGKPVGLRGFIVDISKVKDIEIRDITERKKLEELRNNLFTNISHDLRIPMTLIKGYIETILSGCLNDPEEERKYLRLINDKISAMGNLTEDLMEYAQLSARQIKLNEKFINVSQLLQNMYDRFYPDITRTGLTLILKSPRQKEPEEAATSPLLSVDQDQMNRVFENLIFNAIRYMPAKGTITIGHLLPPKNENKIIVYVKDTGIGISTEDLPYVFNRFYRGTKGIKTDPNGRGLGLAIVREIIEYHKGHIWVDSIVGKGTTFYFSLPVEWQ